MQGDKVSLSIVTSNDRKQHKFKSFFPTGITTHHKGILISLPENGEDAIKIDVLDCTGPEYKKAAEALLSQIKGL
ncbi:MAG TPA: hypothetical protein VD757_01815 [Candidatus Nitrosocosmicus sp.]|nr:hypothetical protein [Candidatus Nitrosocosmicus sp.]